MKYSKPFFALCFLLPSMVLFAQDPELEKIFPMKEGKVFYEKVISLDSVKGNEIFTRAKQWAVQNGSKDYALQAEPQTGSVSTTGKVSKMISQAVAMRKDSIKTEWIYSYDIGVLTKDNRTKITIDNIRFTGLTPGNPMTVENYKAQMESLYKGILNKNQRERHYASVYKSFGEVDNHIKALIQNFESFVKNGSDW